MVYLISLENIQHILKHLIVFLLFFVDGIRHLPEAFFTAAQRRFHFLLPCDVPAYPHHSLHSTRVVLQRQDGAQLLVVRHPVLPLGIRRVALHDEVDGPGQRGEVRGVEVAQVTERTADTARGGQESAREMVALAGELHAAVGTFSY